jgi:hypothetical protein
MIRKSINITEEALAIGKIPPEEVARRIATGQYTDLENLSPRSKEMALLSMAIKEHFQVH